MNFLLLPMWLLSGALFPVVDAPLWLEWIVRLNPMSYSLQALRHSLYTGVTLPEVGLQAPTWMTWVLVFAFAVTTHIVAMRVARRRDEKK